MGSSLPALDGVRERKRGKDSFSRKLVWGEGDRASEVEDIEACARAL